MAVPIFTDFMANALQGKPATPFNVPTGMSTAWINPSTGVKAFEGEAAIAEAFKPGTGPNLMTSVIGLDVQAFDAIQREQLMQQQYGSSFRSTRPSGSGTFLDPSLSSPTSLSD
jgi:penicillin-binding protein 1A